MTTAYHLSDIKVYHDGAEVLGISDLDIAANQCTAVLGENGAGKSTLLHLLAFVQKPAQGRISMLGETVNNGLTEKQRRRIGLVTQQPYLLSGTVMDNIRLALKLQGVDKAEHDDLALQALKTVNLEQLANQNAATLSGGELKRAAIARAIAYQPEILLLDEPFAHLDQYHIQLLENIIASLASQAGKTVIFSTHDRLQAQAIADNSINLIHGHITHTPLLNLFHGRCQGDKFDTGRISIYIPATNPQARHIAIDPTEIIVSSQPMQQSSMLNSFPGRLTQISEEAVRVRLLIDCGEPFHAIITPTSLQKLSLQLGQTVWLSFKASTVTVF